MSSRSMKIDLFVADNLRQPVLDSIRRYRAACRKMFSLLGLSQTAGANLDENGRIKPKTDQAKIIAACSLGTATSEVSYGKKGEGNNYLVKIGKISNYEMRPWFFEELYPTARGFVFDSARQDITVAWNALDPEITKATRGWLTMQGERGFAQFRRRGIGLPATTAKPELHNHTLSLDWDRNLGSIDFKLDNLDGGRYTVWKRLRDRLDGYSLGTIYLSENDGKLFATISYSLPEAKAYVTLSPEGEIQKIQKEIAPDELPETITTTIKNKYPTATTKIIEEIITVKQKEEKLAYYEILLMAEERKLAVQIKTNGDIINERTSTRDEIKKDEKDDAEKIKRKEIPNPVLEAISIRFKDAKMVRTAKTTHNGNLCYKITLNLKGRTDLEPDQTCSVQFADFGEEWIKISGPGRYDSASISSCEASSWVNDLKSRRDDLERRKRACGSPRKPWGFRKGWRDVQERQKRLTERRDNGVKHRNHAWARRIIERAKSWHCGCIKIGTMPPNLAGHPWQWSQLKSFLKYRADLMGATIQFADEPEN